MGLEAATFISELNALNPVGAIDFVREGANHLRLVKGALLTTLPNLNGVVNATPAQLNLLVGLTGNIRTSTSTPLAGEEVLMKSTAISGAPSAVDFINGSGGVTISSAYNEFRLVFTNITQASGNAKLRLDFSINGGSTWAQGVADGAVHRIDGASPTSAALTGVGYVPVNGEQANASENTGIYAEVRLIRNVGTDTFGVFVQYHGATAGRNGSFRGRLVVATGLNAIRAYWDSGAFANTGRIELFGRKS